MLENSTTKNGEEKIVDSKLFLNEEINRIRYVKHFRSINLNINININIKIPNGWKYMS